MHAGMRAEIYMHGDMEALEIVWDFKYGDECRYPSKCSSVDLDMFTGFSKPNPIVQKVAS